MVGDVTVEDAVAAVGATFGALPTRSAAPERPASALNVAFPAPVSEPVRLTHTGQAGQALGYVAWPTTDSIGDRRDARIASLMAEVLQLRVTDELRETRAWPIRRAPGPAPRRCSRTTATPSSRSRRRPRPWTASSRRRPDRGRPARRSGRRG
ncbi:insulinase family protein [Brevundimonas denitrificans]|uniref:insulinase family protein n=1 Tax=Brevundimonas denitrificans TaxID=1443434 RepID=UPI00223ADB4B|nr:insulinase family protein [Brevundimonas denitrificans]